ncbi:MAG TPA: ATP-binding cassette domain-containing protein, partial [Candidatus Binatus sp.]|nr:ATP-binding cassette domain-containing protein [Candidatus Binatus sp.]
MNEGNVTGAALSARAIEKIFHRDGGEVVRALDGISIEVQSGTLTALVGPDGAGKTTLIRLAAGLMTPDAGELNVLGFDVHAAPQQVQDRIGYMPQKFGLYEDLSVQENLDLYADLHGIARTERQQSYPRLMAMTALGPFSDRLAGKLSGGMKQKLGLACTLASAPQLLLLDEPTVGVDPLSRRELWEIILQLVKTQNLTVLLSTSYLDEAEHCEQVVVLHHGKVLAQGPPGDISRLAAARSFLADPPAPQKARDFQARLLDRPEIIDAVPIGGQVRFVAAEGVTVSGAMIDRITNRDDALAGAVVTPVEPRFEDGFMMLLHQTSASRDSIDTEALVSSAPTNHQGAAVEVRDLVRQFGHFTAVDHINFEVQRGEIFGLLRPNGAGKTTTFRMLCGLLPASSGTLRVAGMDLRRARASARQRI